MLPIFKLFFSAFLFLLCTESIPAFPLFWTDHIDSALNQRGEYFKSISTPIDLNGIQNWDYQHKLHTLETLDSTPSLDNAWYHLIRGLVDSSLSDTSQAVFFNRALYLAQSDPGTTWLMFFEFERNKFYDWADRSLEQLEKQMLQSGAYKSRLISEQLINLAKDLEKTEKKQAIHIYNWAKRFDFDQNIPSLRIAIMSFPFDLKNIFVEYRSLLNRLKTSWILQLKVVTELYEWFRWAMICFVAATILTLSFKYTPFALHKLSDILPYTVPIYLRMPLLTAALFSFASFGFILFMWLNAIIVWQFLSRKEMILLSFPLAIMVLSPIDSYINGAVITASNPQKEIQFSSRAINEGYSISQYKSISERVYDSTDYLTPLSAAIYNIKCFDFASAAKHLKKTSSISEEDPVILTTAGNLHFMKRDLEKAESYYKQAIKIDNQNSAALFNLAQCQLRKMQTITAAELISDAAHMQPDFVNNFIHNNEKHFSRNWPAIRQIMFSDFSPGYFWTKLFPHYALRRETSSILWSTKFFAIPPGISMIIFAIMFVSLFIIYRFDSSSKKVRLFFECKFCGRIMCKMCKSGTQLCPSCYGITQFMSNTKSLERMQKTISDKARQISLIKNSIAETLFPGTGQLLKQRILFRKAVPSLLITSIIYSSYIVIFGSINRDNWKYLILPITVMFFYNLYCIIKNMILIYRSLRNISETIY